MWLVCSTDRKQNTNTIRKECCSVVSSRFFGGSVAWHPKKRLRRRLVVLITAEHLRTGKEYDAALIWTEDVTKASFKACLRELQNFDGKHEDISVVCTSKQKNTTSVSVKEDCVERDYLFIYLHLLGKCWSLSLKTPHPDSSLIQNFASERFSM